MSKKPWGGVRKALAAACLLLAGHAFGQQQADDSLIIAAREAVRTGDRNTLERLAAQRGKHVLEPYVRYWLLYNKLARPEQPPVAELSEFILDYPGSMLAERLRGDWLRRLAKDGYWESFAQLYSDLQTPEPELRCFYWTARMMTGDRAVLGELARQWADLADSPAACESVLQAVASAGLVSEADIWQRLRRQMLDNNLDAARTTLRWIPGGATMLPAFEQAARGPGTYLDRLPANFAVQRGGREMALVALIRLARDDVRTAENRLIRIQSRLEADERAYAYAGLALRAAFAQLPEAADWFRAAGDAPMTSEQRAWRVRAALRAGDWSAVRAAIERLPADEQAQPDWTYWLARAQAAAGRQAEADALYARIAGEPHFYGLLAAEEQGRLFPPPTRSGAVTPANLREVEEDPSIRRALALFRLDMRVEGVREWNWALRGQSDGFILAASRLALKNEIYDRAINTAERADPNGNFDLRFLTPHRDVIEPQVRNQGLDISWVYGLMRQESRFVVPARSRSGAQGLMQVMPATGKWVAGKLGMNGYSPSMLSEPTTNVRLGTGYMRLILDDLDNHPLLASAGYNAGPGRARRWRDAKPLEGAIYAETIPFDETRDYVKKVMANTVIYAAMLEGQPQSLKARLGTISARADNR